MNTEIKVPCTKEEAIGNPILWTGTPIVKKYTIAIDPCKIDGDKSELHTISEMVPGEGIKSFIDRFKKNYPNITLKSFNHFIKSLHI